MKSALNSSSSSAQDLAIEKEDKTSIIASDLKLSSRTKIFKLLISPSYQQEAAAFYKKSEYKKEIGDGLRILIQANLLTKENRAAIFLAGKHAITVAQAIKELHDANITLSDKRLVSLAYAGKALASLNTAQIPLTTLILTITIKIRDPDAFADILIFLKKIQIELTDAMISTVSSNNNFCDLKYLVKKNIKTIEDALNIILKSGNPFELIDIVQTSQIHGIPFDIRRYQNEPQHFSNEYFDAIVPLKVRYGNLLTKEILRATVYVNYSELEHVIEVLVPLKALEIETPDTFISLLSKSKIPANEILNALVSLLNADIPLTAHVFELVTTNVEAARILITLQKSGIALTDERVEYYIYNFFNFFKNTDANDIICKIIEENEDIENTNATEFCLTTLNEINQFIATSKEANHSSEPEPRFRFPRALIDLIMAYFIPMEPCANHIPVQLSAGITLSMASFVFTLRDEAPELQPIAEMPCTQYSPFIARLKESESKNQILSTQEQGCATAGTEFKDDSVRHPRGFRICLFNRRSFIPASQLVSLDEEKKPQAEIPTHVISFAKRL